MMAEPDPLAWLEAERHGAGTRLAFRQQLESTDEVLVGIGGQLTDWIVPMTRAFLEADRHAVDELHAASRGIDPRCEELEDACYVLIARQSPVAGDLRHLVAALRSVVDLARTNNLVRHIGSALDWVHPPAMPEATREIITSLGHQSATVFAGGVAAWRDHDGLAANELDVTDDQVDLLQKALLTEVYTGGRSIEEAVSLALIGRYFERIGDHGVELARHVTYFLTGDRVRPSGS